MCDQRKIPRPAGTEVTRRLLVHISRRPIAVTRAVKSCSRRSGDASEIPQGYEHGQARVVRTTRGTHRHADLKERTVTVYHAGLREACGRTGHMALPSRALQSLRLPSPQKDASYEIGSGNISEIPRRSNYKYNLPSGPS